jgi:hypothetical protein
VDEVPGFEPEAKSGWGNPVLFHSGRVVGMCRRNSEAIIGLYVRF